MRIALDARTVYARRRRGTGKNLLDAYATLARLRPQWEFLLYHRGTDEDPFAEVPNVRSRSLDMPGDRWNLWQNVRLPQAAAQDRAHLLHCPANSCPVYSPVPTVTTIHDLIPLKVSDPAGPLQAVKFRRMITRSLRRSRRIITVSKCTKKDLVSDLGADPALIDVIGWAPDSNCVPVTDQAELKAIRSRYNIAGRYMLAFSGRSYRKNAEGMIRGYALLPAALRRVVQFLLVGVQHAGQRRRLEQLIRNLQLPGRCLVTGHVPEGHVAPLISGADLLCFCSLYEGFGLPILDAFRCRTAVLTSNCSSLPEVGGDAAEYCDPRNHDSIAAGMSALLRDDTRRRTLIHQGQQRLEQFSWRRTAEAMCGTFERCLQPATIRAHA